MLIKNTTINIVFPKIDNVKKQYILHEETLQKNYNEATILPVPDDAPTEIPRIIVKSKGEHSQLSIASESATLEVKYTDNYLSDWSKCAEYLQVRTKDLTQLINNMGASDYKYVGVVTNVIWNPEAEAGNRVLYRNLFRKEPPENLDDLVVRYTYVDAEKYYTNLTFQSTKLFDNQSDGVNMTVKYDDSLMKGHTISAVIDVNDRYSYNNIENYISGPDEFSSLIELTTDIINHKIENISKGGDYDGR